MRLFIEPNDVLFFRDGRPFESDGDGCARLAFPPTPATFYGALSSAILSQHNADFAQLSYANWDIRFEEISPDAKHRTMRIQLFGLAKRNYDREIERVFPTPFDLMQEKGSLAYHILAPTAKEYAVNLPGTGLRLLQMQKLNEDIVLDKTDGYLTESGMSAYLQQEFQPKGKKYLNTSSEVYLSEPRIGLRTDVATNSSESGFLFTLEFARMHNDWGFLVELNSKLFEPSKDPLRLLRLGGEGRSARYEIVENELAAIRMPEISRRFKLILLTPAIFENGWLPDGIDEKSLQGEIAGVAVKLVSAAVGHYVGIGGWDIQRRQSKPVRRAAPAGSVYFFEHPDGADYDQEALENAFQMKSIMTENKFLTEGLGLTIIGDWNYV